MKNSDVLYLTSRSIEQWQPEHKQNHQKIEKLKESKLNKNAVIAKTLEAFKPKAIIFPLKNYFKNKFKTIFFPKPLQYYICKTWKNSLALEDRLTGRWRKNFINQLQFTKKMLLKIVK